MSGIVATVFGASGFLGRYVIPTFGHIGSQCIIPYRGDGMNVRHLKISGDLGQIVPVPCQISDEESVRKAVARSNVVINLIGTKVQTLHWKFHDVHVKIPYRLAKLAKEAGVERFIHVSALGAAQDGSNDYFRTKWEGEQAVRQVFPEATILRPAPIFGNEDSLLNRWAMLVKYMPFLPEFGNSLDQRMQPVYVHDVARAILHSVTFPNAPGQTFELVGPEVLTLRELIEYIEKQTVRGPKHLAWFPKAFNDIFHVAWTRMMPWKNRKLYFSEDNAHPYGPAPDLVASGALPGLQDLGVDATSIHHIAPHILMRYRSIRAPVFQGHVASTVQEREQMRKLMQMEPSE